MIELNDKIYSDTDDGRFITVNCCLLDKRNSLLEFGRAGHTELITFVHNHLRVIYPDRNILTFRETASITGQEALDLQKKTDGVVNILGEVASMPVASFVVQLSQMGTKMTMFTNHANSTEKMIQYFRNALLAEHGFHDEVSAREQVVDAINFDIHMKKEKDGKRYIERISQIVVDSNTDKGYRVVDLITYDENGYQVMNGLDETTVNKIVNHLTKDEEEKLQQFVKLLQQTATSLRKGVN